MYTPRSLRSQATARRQAARMREIARVVCAELQDHADSIHLDVTDEHPISWDQIYAEPETVLVERSYVGPDKVTIIKAGFRA